MATIISGDNINAPGTITAGLVKITGGAPGLNKVLTSDAVGLASWQVAGAASITTGSWAITNGVDTEIVTGLALGFAPTAILATVRKAAGDLNLYATIVTGTITADGFEFCLNGVTDSANYILDFLVIP